MFDFFVQEVYSSQGLRFFDRGVKMQANKRFNRKGIVMKKLVTIMLSLLVIAGAFVFGAEVKAEAATAKLSKSKVTLEVGDSKKIKVKGTKTKVVWSTSDKKVATVKSGKITAKGEGTCEITAKVGKKTLTCKVTVNAKKAITFDSSVKFGELKLPVMSTWEKATDPIEMEGFTILTYTDNDTRVIVYEFAYLGELLDSLSDENFETLGDAFTEGLLASYEVDDLKRETVKVSGVSYGIASGTVSDTMPMAYCYKFENGYFISSIVMDASDKASADIRDLALESCKATKKAK